MKSRTGDSSTESTRYSMQNKSTGYRRTLPRNARTSRPWKPANEYLTSSGAQINHDQADRCFYNRASDSIHLTPKETFNDATGYYGTALHELAHWTGHPSRLDRSTLNESYRFGDPAYARRSCGRNLQVCSLPPKLAFRTIPSNHAAYVGSWIQALRKDKNEIFRAAHDASDAADFVFSLDRERAKSATKNGNLILKPERENSRFASRYEPGSGTVSVHDKRFGNDHHTPVRPDAALPTKTGVLQMAIK